jgi:hypothetical protein
MRAVGGVDLAARQMWLELDLADFGASMMEVRFAEPLLYVRGEAFEAAMGDADWLGMDLSTGDPVTDDFRDLVTGQNDSALALYWLLGATRPAVPLKREPVRGIDTQRFVVQLDLAAAVPLVPDRMRPALEANVEEFRTRGVEPLMAADAWVGDDGLVHRVRYEFQDVPAPITSMAVIYDFSGFGEPLARGVPGEDEVVLWLTEEPAST